MKLCYMHVLWVLLRTRHEHARVYVHECDHTFALLLRLMREVADAKLNEWCDSMQHELGCSQGRHIEGEKHVRADVRRIPTTLDVPQL